ncbi:MAG TPA: nitrite reductase small subunit NirD [Gammaproteobacteria bacterium]|nr:nitrite reductase small subunit NirD [Gammaproteobacteria bacterium]
MANWIEVGSLEDIPKLGSRIIEGPDGDIAIFRNSKDEVFALKDACPHKQGPLSQGIVHDKTVTCPLHNWKIELDTGEAQAPDEGCAGRYDVKMDANKIFLAL